MTRHRLLTLLTVIGIVGAVVGLLGTSADQTWGSTVSAFFLGLALVGVVCLMTPGIATGGGRARR